MSLVTQSNIFGIKIFEKKSTELVLSDVQIISKLINCTKNIK